MITTKIFDPSDLQLDEGSRSVVATISTDDVDRAGDVVLPKGLAKKNYAGNPVVLSGHNYDQLPIGKAAWVKQDSRSPSCLIAKYTITDKTELGRDTFALLQEGILNAHSIGFSILDQSAPTPEEMDNPKWKDARNMIRSWELLEFSVVAVPCNQNALALAVSKGISRKTLDFLSPNWEQPTIKRGNPWSYTPAAEPTKVISIPTPTYCRNYAEIEKRINASLTEANNMLRRLKGG